ncbi:MAG: hypothetical protein AVO38_02595 [delta proteobacterium ML8_D]|nr:MAG: hypothetical protein AVO38_02595 [delta proteobacterium ML8_D]
MVLEDGRPNMRYVLEDLSPLGCAGMPEGIHLCWRAIDDSQCLSDFSICVCVDAQEDGVFTTTSYTCGCLVYYN